MMERRNTPEEKCKTSWLFGIHVPSYHSVWQIHELCIAVIDRIRLLKGQEEAVKAGGAGVGISLQAFFDYLECWMISILSENGILGEFDLEICWNTDYIICPGFHHNIWNTKDCRWVFGLFLEDLSLPYSLHRQILLFHLASLGWFNWEYLFQQSNIGGVESIRAAMCLGNFHATCKHQDRGSAPFIGLRSKLVF